MTLFLFLFSLLGTSGLLFHSEIHNAQSRRHIAFEVENLEAFRQHLQTLEIEIIPDRQPIADCDRFYLRDPAGNRIEILEHHS